MRSIFRRFLFVEVRVKSKAFMETAAGDAFAVTIGSVVVVAHSYASRRSSSENVLGVYELAVPL